MFKQSMVKPFLVTKGMLFHDISIVCYISAGSLSYGIFYCIGISITLLNLPVDPLWGFDLGWLGITIHCMRR